MTTPPYYLKSVKMIKKAPPVKEALLKGYFLINSGRF